MSSGAPVEEIHSFCSANVSISKRHKLQTWASDKYSIHLEIYDGPAITQFLSDRDTFFLAQEYLKIPSDLYPRSELEGGDKWYRDSLTRFMNGAEFLRSYANFSTVRLAARHAERSFELRQDLPFWLGLIERFIDYDIEIGLRRRVIYEGAYLSFKGLGTLLGKEDQLREYFKAMDDLDEASDLEDVSNLLKLCITAQRGNRILLSLDEIANWWDIIIHIVENKVREVKSPNGKCLFLELRGHLSDRRSSPTANAKP